MFTKFGTESLKNELLLIARVLIVLLYGVRPWGRAV
jgi:hypothetical protein